MHPYHQQQVPMGLMDYAAAMQQGAPRNPADIATYGVNPDTGPAPPMMPQYKEEADPFKPGDPSAMAAYGMAAPALQDPLAQLQAMISMAPPPKPQVQIPQGDLMSYLAQLGVV